MCGMCVCTLIWLLEACWDEDGTVCVDGAEKFRSGRFTFIAVQKF